MNKGIVVVGAIMLGYLMLSLGYAVLVSRMEDGSAKKRLQHVFIAFNIVLFSSGIIYAFLNFSF